MRESRRTLLIGLLLGVATLAVYWPVVRHQFINFDDLGYIIQNFHVRAGLSWSSVTWAFTTDYAANWHPLTWLSHCLDCQLFGMNAGGHHLTSALLHAVNTGLLFLVLVRMTGATWRSAFVAALFGLHPLHVESVAWVAERKDVLSTFFGLLAIGAYAQYVKSTVRGQETGDRKQETGDRRQETADSRQETESSIQHPVSSIQNQAPRATLHPPRLIPFASFYYALALLFFALGLMSKPMLVTLPFVLLLLDYWPLQRMPVGRGVPTAPPPAQGSRAADWGQSALPTPLHPFKLRIKNLELKIFLPFLREKLPFFLLAALSSLVTFLAQRHSGAVAAVSQVPLEHRVPNALISYVVYLKKMLWPTDLAIYYPYRDHVPLGLSVGAVLVLVVLSVLAVAVVRRRPYLAVGWCWYLGTLVPVIGLVQVGLQSMADRYTYIPSIGIFIMVAWGIPELVEGLRGGILSRGRRPSGVVGSNSRLVPALHSPLPSPLTPLHSPGPSPLTPLPSDGRGEPGRGEAGRGGPRDAGRGTADQSGSNVPQSQGSRRAIAWALGVAAAAVLFAFTLCTRAQLRYWQDSITLYRRTLEVTPGNPIVHGNLGSALVEQGKLTEAAEEFAEALRLKPQYAEAESNWGFALALQGKLEEAIAKYRAALAIKPDMERTRYTLGQALLMQGKRDEAIAEYRAALEINPDWPAPLNDLAWFRATDPDPRKRDGPEAVTLAERACRLTGFQQALFVGTLAAAYAEAGRFDEAIQTGEKARQLALAAGQKELADKNRQLLELYRARKAYHEAQPTF